MSKIEVMTICNALVDLVVEATDADLHTFGLKKGNMHLIDLEQREKLLRYFSGHEKTVELGGSSLNAIRALAGLGKTTYFAGSVAEDEFGTQIAERMLALGIRAKLTKPKQEQTGSCLVLVTPDGERTMNTYLGASRLYDQELIPYDEISHARYFHFCGYQWDTPDQKATIIKALQLAKAAQVKVSFDLADPFVVSLHKDEFIPIIKDYADVVFANQEEAKLLLGQNVEKTADWIAQQGATAVIKLGAQGALVRKGGTSHSIPVVPTQVVDTTAAGDMFAAGFLFGLLEDLSLPECGKVAATLASDVISRYGATLSEEVTKELVGAYLPKT